MKAERQKTPPSLMMVQDAPQKIIGYFSIRITIINPYFLVDMMRACTCFLFLLFQVVSASAQLKGLLKHYSTEDGLSHDGVLCITRDKEGFMWIGTWDGINRFDGHKFVAYKSRPGDNSSLKNNKIRNIVEDRDGFLWVKTYDQKIYRFDKRTERFLAVEDEGLKDTDVDKIIPVSGGSTWLLTAGKGLICASNKPSSPKPGIRRYSSSERGDFRIPSNTVNFLFEDTQRKLWIGTAAGLCRLTPGDSGAPYRKAAFRGTDNVYHAGLSFTCAVQKGEFIYFGTRQGMLVIFNTLSGKFRTKMLAAGTELTDICISRKKTLYISTRGRGLISLDPLSLQASYTDLPGANSGYSIYEDKAGRLWIEPEKEGVIRYDPVAKTARVFIQKKDSDAVSPNKNYTVFEDVNGTLWARLKGGGFGYYNQAEDRLEYFYNEPGSPGQRFSNILTALYADKTGILWIGTADGGLNKITFPGNNFNHKLLAAGAVNRSANEVRVLFEDSRKRLWAGSKAGKLEVFKDGKRLSDILLNNTGGEIGNVYCIMEDKEGNIWLGTKGNGLLLARPLDKARSRYSLERFLSDPNDPHSLSSNLVYSVIQDKKGRIWVGTLGNGLNQVVMMKGRTAFRNAGNTFRNYPPSCNVVRYLAEDAAGRIWVATTNGLLLFNPDEGAPENYQFLKYSKQPGDPASLGNNDVQFIYRDRTNTMWVGTFGGGLNKVISKRDSKDLKFRVYTWEDGLPNDIILSIAEDRNGYLWLATENGLSRFDSKEERFTNYDSYDGLPETEFSEAACFRSHSGDMYFGCERGYIFFDPLAIYSRKTEARMALTNIQIYNEDLIAGAAGSALKEPLNYTDHIVLDYDHDVITLDYTVLDYRAEHKVHYAYMLKDYDKGWHDVKNQRRATYTNLPPGEYEFVVQSRSGDLFSNTPSKSVKITILPPPWRSTAAYIIYGIIALIIAAAARKIIVSMIRLRNKVVIEHRLTELKLQFFTNISHELRTPLSLIVSPLEQLKRSPGISDQGLEYIGIISRNARRLTRFVDQLLDFRKVQSEKIRLNIAEAEIIGLTKEIAMHFGGLSEEKNIQLKVSADTAEARVWIDEEKFEIIIYNLLSNAFKFSPDHSTIQLHIDSGAGKGYVQLSITDQGCGVPADQLENIFELYHGGDNPPNAQLKGTGIGLAHSRELMHAHKGTISASNNAHGGMTFTLKFLKGLEHFENEEVCFVERTQASPVMPPLEREAPPAGKVNAAVPAPVLAKLGLVLLVEDNVELRSFLASQFSAFYEVLEAENGREGYELACAKLPDLIISDVMMPEMDGIQMLDRLRNTAETSHVPVILLTAKSSVENQIEGLRYGADFYITKPFHLDHVMVLVENLLKRRKKQFELLMSPGAEEIAAPQEEPLITAKDKEFLDKVIRIVEEKMADSEFNIETVAESVGLGRTTFYKKLKGLAGLAPVELVRDMRLKRSRELLDSGGYTISEIAYMTGFRSSAYFSTCFKDKFKLSPSAYLKSSREPCVNDHG